jgi:hypothetical protein
MVKAKKRKKNKRIAQVFDSMKNKIVSSMDSSEIGNNKHH